MRNPSAPLAKAFVVLLCLVSWFVVSNHCALAALAKAAVHAEGCCAKKAPSEKDSTVCCKTLQTTESVAFTLATPLLVAVAESNLTPLSFFPLPAGGECLSAIRVADPPTLCTTVLDAKRCHPAFAPPRFS